MSYHCNKKTVFPYIEIKLIAMERIKITPLERKVLRHCLKKPYDPALLPTDWQEAWKSLMGKAEKYMQDNDLVDEMMDYTPDSNLLVWVDYRLALQTLNKEALRRIEDSAFKINEFSPEELRGIMSEVRAEKRGDAVLDGVLWLKMKPFKEQYGRNGEMG